MTIGYVPQFEAILQQVGEAKRILSDLQKQIGLYVVIEGGQITPQMFLQSGDKQVELPDVFNDPATRAAALAYLVESVKSDMAQLADLCWRLEA